MRQLSPEEATKLFSGSGGRKRNQTVRVDQLVEAFRKYHSGEPAYCASTMADELGVDVTAIDELLLLAKK